MLIGVPPCLGPQLLAGLRAMGHGDEIAVVDGNYPAQAHCGAGSTVIRSDGLGLVPLLDAILTVLPLDDDVEAPIAHATVGGDGRTLDAVHREITEVCRARAPRHRVRAMPGREFYERVKQAQIIVATGEPRLYANVILRKGVIRPS